MKKNLLGVFMIIIAMLFMPVIVSARIVDSGICGENITWMLDDEGTLTLSGNGAIPDYEYDFNVDHPGYYQYLRYNIKKIVVGNGITRIGEFAFANLYGCHVEEIVLPETLTAIGKGAFLENYEIVNIDIPSAVTIIDDNAFAWCISLKTVKLQKGIKKLGKSIFYGALIEEIMIPDTIESLEEGIFDSCPLRKITVEELNKKYKVVDGVLYSKDGKQLVCVPSKSDKTGIFIVPDGVERICSYAFQNCGKITNVVIPNSVKELGESFLMNCINISSLYIPSSIVKTDEYTFWTGIGCEACVNDLYYEGTEQGWNEIAGEEGATIYWSGTCFHFNAVGIAPPIITSVRMFSSGSAVNKIGVEFADTEYDSTLITAFYKDGQMVDMKITTISAGDDTEDVTVPEGIDVDEAKVFIWSSLDKMKPLCEAKTIKL